MADLVLQIGPHPTYEDGDILCAFSERRISHVHCSHICSPVLRPDLNPRTRGHLTPGTLVEDLKAASHRYKFERISKTEVRRTDMLTLVEHIFDATPRDIDGKMQHIYVDEWIRRRRADPAHELFGDVGSEYWYGGETTPTEAALDGIWSRIEGETRLLKADHSLFPLSDIERKRFLPVAHERLDDVAASALTAPLLDLTNPRNPVTLKKRASQIDWKAQYGERQEIMDKEMTADLRNETATKPSDVIAKEAQAAIDTASAKGLG